MGRGVFMRRFLLCGGLVACVFAFAAPLAAQTPARGNLVGSFFEKDGTTPVVGAVIKLRNISSGAIYEAPPSDKTGFFRLDGLAKGIYNFGITTTAGDFNSNELIGIIENETTKISISLSIYEGEIRQAGSAGSFRSSPGPRKPSSSSRRERFRSTIGSASGASPPTSTRTSTPWAWTATRSSAPWPVRARS
jgi:hypothetical protein